MRVLDGDQILVRVFIGDSDKWHHQPLSVALLERLRREGFAGATITHGIAGFGARSVIHTAQILDLSSDLPVILEVVDTAEHVGRLEAILDDMLVGGLVTVENVHVLRYAPTKKAG